MLGSPCRARASDLRSNASPGRSFTPPRSGGKRPISRISRFELLNMSEIDCLPSSTLPAVVSSNSLNSAASNSFSKRLLARSAKAVSSVEGESLVNP